MKRFVVVVAMLACAGCSGSDTTPTPVVPIQSANIIASGPLNIAGCFQIANSLFSCNYSGTAQNLGQGCASNVRGSVVSFSPGNVQVGTSQFVYFLDVRPGERIVYNGQNLSVPSATWTYNAQLNWDSVRC